MSGKKAGAIGFIPIIVIASVFGAYLDLARLTPSSSPGSLVLSASANPTSIADKDGLNIIVSLYNKLPGYNVILPSNDWTFQGFSIAMWPPCTGDHPVSFVVVKGNYSLDALRSLATSANSSWLSRFFPSCSAGYIVNYLTFQPNNDLASVEGTFSGGIIFAGEPARTMQNLGAYELAANFTINGYWDFPITFAEAANAFNTGSAGFPFTYPEITGPIAAHPFTPGTYRLRSLLAHIH